MCCNIIAHAGEQRRVKRAANYVSICEQGQTYRIVSCYFMRCLESDVHLTSIRAFMRYDNGVQRRVESYEP